MRVFLLVKIALYLRSNYKKIEYVVWACSVKSLTVQALLLVASDSLRSSNVQIEMLESWWIDPNAPFSSDVMFANLLSSAVFWWEVNLGDALRGAPPRFNHGKNHKTSFGFWYSWISSSCLCSGRWEEINSTNPWKDAKKNKKINKIKQSNVHCVLVSDW